MTSIRRRPLRRLLLLASIVSLGGQFVRAGAELKIGAPAPPVHLAFPFARPLDSVARPGSAPGRARVLEFWATWCAPCVAALPHLNQLVQEFKHEPIDFVSVTDEEESLVRRFLATHQMDGIVAIDEGGQTWKDYGLTFFPTTVLIDADGRLVAVTSPSHVDAAVLHALLTGEPIKLPLPIGLLRPDDAAGRSSHQAALISAVIRLSAEQDDDDGGISCEHGKLTLQGVTLRTILSRVYDLPTHRIDMPKGFEAQRYDALIAKEGATSATLLEMLGRLLPTALNVRMQIDSKNAQVFILSLPSGQVTKLSKSAATVWEERGGPGSLRFTATPLSHLASAIAHELGRDVLDETGTEGAYDLSLNWNPAKPESILAAVEGQLGLSVTHGQRPMKFLTVSEDADSGGTVKHLLLSAVTNGDNSGDGELCRAR